MHERSYNTRLDDRCLRIFLRYAPIGAGLLVLAGCATTFDPAPVPGSPFIGRAVTQSESGITVSASVLSSEEFERITGIDFAGDEIQPVWLSVDNDRDVAVRIAYVSIDPDYYSPLEVAWSERKRFRKRSRDELDGWFYSTRLPRGVPAGTTRSGFVYTHATQGTKGFNVDIYEDTNPVQFTFFVPMPGFRPDYMDVDFTALYADREIMRTDREGLRDVVQGLPCCTTDESGQGQGDPLNLVLVGSAQAVRRSLLRGGWQETESGSALTQMSREHRFLGRPPDGTFFRSRPDGAEMKEMRLWLAPLAVDGFPVWIGSVSYEMSGNPPGPDVAGLQIDPDIDDARMYVMQNLWYSQSLEAFALARSESPVPIEAPRTNFLGQPWFTDGYRAVLFVAEDPIAMDETEILFWEPFIGR